LKTEERPNFLWVSFEDTSPTYGCYADPVARTPNLDRLASEGCVWRNAFSTAGVCAPARSAIITGMYPTSIGTHHMRTTHTNPHVPRLPTPYSAVVPHYVKCFTEYLRAAGYYCTNNVKTDYQFDPPFTAWDELSTKAHWRNRPDPDQPFFSVFNLDRTHESGMWPEKCPDLSFDPDEMIVPPYLPDTPKVRQALARMYTNIEYNDRLLGELLSQLEEDGLSGNTVVFHWSDHGPLPRGKRWLYDSGIRVPLIVRWPGHLEPGSVRDDLVSTVDLAPTVLSIAGLPIPAYMQGRAFLGPQASRPRRYVYASRDRHDESYDMVRAVRDRRFKYIRNYYAGTPYFSWIPYRNRHPIVQEMWRMLLEGQLTSEQLLVFQPRPAEELYDTWEDPHEIHTLTDSPEYRGVLERLRGELDRWMREIGDMGRIREAEMVSSWLQGGAKPRTAPPLFIPICRDNPGLEPAPEGGTFKGSLLVQIYCATQGASIGYRLDDEAKPRWLLYTQPLRLPVGATRIRAKAVRIGFEESEERVATFIVEPPDG